MNKPQAYSDFIAYTLPFVAILIICDVIQLILAASLRGGSDVKTVMLSRVAATFLFFIPLAYLISLLPLQNIFLKFVLLYASVHVSYALMGIIYIGRFRSKRWNGVTVKPAVKDTEKQPHTNKQQKPFQSTN